MTSTVVCGYAGAAWEINSAGQDACQQYAALVGTCQSSFIVGPVTPSDPPYIPVPGNAACSCNVVAYNLAAACGWCQDAIQPSWWATEPQWRGNCTDLSETYNPLGLPASVPTASLTIPPWALATVNSVDDTWSPSRASLLAVAGTTGTTNTNTRFVTPTSLGGLTIGLGGSTTRYGYNPSTYSPNTNDPYGIYGQVATASAGAVAIYVGVVIGLWALTAIVVGIVFFMRQKKRKAWYGPVAEFYRGGGMPGSGGQPGFAAPLLYHNEPNVPGSPHHTGTNTLPSHSPAPSSNPVYTAYQPPPPGPPGSNAYAPYQAYNDPRQSYVPPPGSAAGGGYMGSDHGYPPNTPGSNPNTNPFNTPYSTPGAQGQGHGYGGPPQGPPPGAAGAHGYSGHAEVY